MAWLKDEDGAWGYVAGSGGGSDGAVPCSGWEGEGGGKGAEMSPPPPGQCRDSPAAGWKYLPQSCL